MIQITVNNEAYTVAINATIANILNQLQIPLQGIAIAVNQEIVSKTDWETHIITENQHILIIKATQGG